MVSPSIKPPATFLKAVFQSLRKAFFSMGLASAVINLLALTGSMFMLQVYDRVLPGRSVPTLLGLALIAAVLFAFQGVLELLRSLMLARIGVSLDQRLNRGVFRSLVGPPVNKSASNDGLQSVRDLDQVRTFLSGPGPTALFDLPWMPLYIAVCFLFHFWIGVTALGGALVLVALAALAEFLSHRPARMAAQFSSQRFGFAEDARRNWESITAMGFADRLADRWSDMSNAYFSTQLKAANIVSLLTASSRVLRMMLQSGVLAVGAFLVIRQEATGGIIIASSILVSRALAPVELSIGQWRGFAAARQSWSRLVKLLDGASQTSREVKLPAPKSALSVENLTVAAPGKRDLVLRSVSFSLDAGSILGVIGPSASGKTSLARALAGLWPSAIGAVKLDQAALAQWDPAERGRHIGYLPQDVRLLDGSIAENISRFEPDAPSEAILAAADAAGITDMIVNLPDGFDTRIGEGAAMLSAGQRQRVALARALYGAPFLVILDEPNSNLDADGEAALAQALAGVRARGGIAVVVAHRPSVLAVADRILVLATGQMQAFGPRDAVLGKIARTPAPGSFRVTYGKDLAS
ncbi:MAG: type I secretion system permease/ATPase [Shinella sp.]|nr:type I secretion system permease/ATPase [Shinella sp.]